MAFTENMMTVFFDNGREILIPLEWYPGLKDATLEQLKKWELTDNGNKIHWDELDEEIAIGKMM